MGKAQNCKHEIIRERRIGIVSDTLYRCFPVYAEMCVTCGKVFSEWSKLEPKRKYGVVRGEARKTQ